MRRRRDEGTASARPDIAAAGGRGTITITASQSAGGRQVTLYPGGITFTIMVDQGHHPFAPGRGT